MLTEIEYAASFLVDTLSQELKLTLEESNKLREKIQNHLEKRYENHWYSDKPMKGSAYRCINVSCEDSSVDQVLRDACEECNITTKTLLSIFSKGLALWVDPNDVSCRLGKGAIFPIYKKISESNKQERSSSPNELMGNNIYKPSNSQRRPQQRPRSISPRSVYESSDNIYHTRPRSTTPPGFSSMDAGKMYQSSYMKPSMSIEDVQKLWNTIPNTTTYNSYSKSTSLYTPTYSKPSDSSYSFNQYSSYYNPTQSKNSWKKSSNNGGSQKYYKTSWQDDEVYNRYHWSRKDSMLSTGNNTSLNQYYNSALQAQEVC